MAGGSAAVEAGLSPEFERRREAWAAGFSSVDWVLDRAVADSFRIERCERAMETALPARHPRPNWSPTSGAR
jgi:hypothetical protein